MSESVSSSPYRTDAKDAPARSHQTIVWFALLAPAVVGLAASTMLLVDYLKPAPVFCSAVGGCEQIRHTLMAYPMGIPMPAFGVLGFATIAALLFFRGSRVRSLNLGVAGAAALVGGFLLGVQFVLGTICVYCAITDTSALLALGAALFRIRREIDPPRDVQPVSLAIGLLLSSASAPALLGLSMHPQVPSAIAIEMKDTPRGELTIVDFVDFQCPFCRQTHADLKPILNEHPGKIRVVRKQVPLSFHAHALDAARASCCGEKLGKGDEMADALFTTPVEELTPEGCAKIAAQLGIDSEEFKKCMADPATDKRIDRDRETFHAVGGEGLPTLFVGVQKIEGARGPEVLKRAVDQALSGT